MSAHPPRILIAEQDPVARAFLTDNLAADGFQPLPTPDARHARNQLTEPAEALLVDVNGDTLGLVESIRHDIRSPINRELPILALTSHGDPVHRTRLLERGADDVLEKPYAYPELRARLTALLRRARGQMIVRTAHAGQLRLDLVARRVWIGERELDTLPPKEHALLATLIADPERVFTRQELLASVWDLGSWARTRTLDSHAARLRAHLNIDGERRYVHNVWGIGYRLLDPQVTRTAVHVAQ